MSESADTAGVSWLRRVREGRVKAPPPASAMPVAAAPSSRAPDGQAVLALVCADGPGESPSPADEERAATIGERVLAYFLEYQPEARPLPDFALRVMELAQDPDADLFELSQLVEQDAAIASRVLQVSNSALYRRVVEVQTVRGAITQLGLFAIAKIAVSVASRAMFDAGSRLDYELFASQWNRLSHHSLTTAFAASELATRFPRARPEQAFFGGIFHDIGKTLALRSLAALVRDNQVPRPSDDCVDLILERQHVAIGTAANEVGSLPRYLSTICRFHHADSLPAYADLVELHLVRVVSTLNALRVNPRVHQSQIRELLLSAGSLPLDEQQVRQSFGEVTDAAAQVSQSFHLPDGRVAGPPLYAMQ